MLPARPLAGRRILVTRASGQAASLADQLRALGATPVLVPVIEIVPPTSFAGLDTALEQISTFDWVVFTSANAVTALISRIDRLARNPVLPRVACIGRATAAALRATQLIAPETSILLPGQAIAESLLKALLPEVGRLIAGQGRARLLLIRAEDARELLPEQLRQAGADVTVVPAYRNRVPSGSAASLRLLLGPQAPIVDGIPFTSSSSVTHLLALLEAAGLTLPVLIPRVSIGPITSETLRAHGLPPHAEASEPTVPALVNALVRTLAERA